jgi:hypothetical protein
LYILNIYRISDTEKGTNEVNIISSCFLPCYLSGFIIWFHQTNRQFETLKRDILLTERILCQCTFETKMCWTKTAMIENIINNVSTNRSICTTKCLRHNIAMTEHRWLDIEMASIYMIPVIYHIMKNKTKIPHNVKVSKCNRKIVERDWVKQI